MAVVEKVYGRRPSTVNSVIIADFELIAYRKGIRIAREEAQIIREFVDAIVDHVLSGYDSEDYEIKNINALEQERNLNRARAIMRKVAERILDRVKATQCYVDSAHSTVGSKKMRYLLNNEIFGSLCPPPLPPLCFAA
ncbi:hypothetical protein [Azospirillum sp. B4]|uniref:hypothetical protein n=1 Tax=Azospirillum sp. B4 TaxID=95605 RepID=UPI0011DCC926|nr:hypothetical protein [Azospirillum sp. B4]